MTVTPSAETQPPSRWTPGRGLAAFAIAIVGTLVTYIAVVGAAVGGCWHDCNMAASYTTMAVFGAVPLTMTITGIWALGRSTTDFLVWLVIVVVLALCIGPVLTALFAR